MKRVVVLGAGIGGQIISKNLTRLFNDKVEVILLGQLNTSTSEGLFYLDDVVKGVKLRAVPVEYLKIGEGSINDYQIKSRNFLDPNIKVSSFDKVGMIETGYLINEKVDLSSVTVIEELASKVNLESKYILTDNLSIEYDYLISTVPLMIFTKLIDSEVLLSSDFKYNPVFIEESIMDDSSNNITCKIDVTYDTKKDSPFYRITDYRNSYGEIIKTIKESIDDDLEGKERIKKIYPGKIIPSSKVNDFVKLLENNFNNIKLCGRFARWDYHYMITDSVKDAINFITQFI